MKRKRRENQSPFVLGMTALSGPFGGCINDNDEASFRDSEGLAEKWRGEPVRLSHVLSR